MAEAHAAVAFTFKVTDEGTVIDVNRAVLHQVFVSWQRSWKHSIYHIKNRFANGLYPSTPTSWVVITGLVTGCYMAKYDPSLGIIEWISKIPAVAAYGEETANYAGCVAFSTAVWFAKAMIERYSLKLCLQYQGWLFAPHGKMSFVTKIWLGTVKLLEGRHKKLMSYQSHLPRLPVPALKDTMKRYLRSVRPLLDDEHYRRMERLVTEFEGGVGRKFQRYLTLKSWWANNYVSDWWEEYVYLRGRSPIMVNSNFYGLDAIFHQPTSVQAARAANIVYSMIKFRRDVFYETIPPLLVNKTVPLCSTQYERQFNTTRIPGIETDTLQHMSDSTYVAVYHKGRYYKVYILHQGDKKLTPAQLEISFQKILDDDSEPVEGEEHLAALTAGDRVPWAKAREQYFRKGVNKTSLDSIEKAAFFVTLDEEAHEYDPNDQSKLNNFAHSMLHGKCHDRWFDKSFTLVVCANGRIGFNGEHSWSDAPIMGQLWEYTLAEEFYLGYTEDGHCKGEVKVQPPNPIRLQWDLSKECQNVISESLTVARALADDVDMSLMMHDDYGKGFMKKCRISPDAYIQMALQLAYYRDAKKFCLTYEASMTRMFLEGRTETVRSCTVESCAFVKSMDDPSKTNKERIQLLKAAADVHQSGYRLAMTGGGIDRHLFCLYVVSRYLGIDTPFLKEVLSEPWCLSTSQSPHQQTDKIDFAKHPEFICAGGGFGPVADDGYGISYIVAGENCIFFHISSKRSSAKTSSNFREILQQALADVKAIF